MLSTVNRGFKLIRGHVGIALCQSLLKAVMRASRASISCGFSSVCRGFTQALNEVALQQAVAIIRELQPFTGNGKYLFPSLRTKERPISDVTLNAALRRLGFSSEEQTAHRFRTIADTFLNELGFPPDNIELQLAHKESNKVRAAYNRAQRLDERRKMMQLGVDISTACAQE